jgi:hypothetical protein
MSAFDAHLAAMNESLAAAFGESATYTPSGGSSEEITGIWDFSDEAQARGEGNTSLAGIFTAQLTEFSVPPARNASVTVRGTVYVVRNDPADDGGGMIELHLRKK